MGKYEVIAKCGHVRKSCYVLKAFPVEAESAKDAARIVRRSPRVKHDQKGAILSVRKIDEARFLELKAQFDQDPYFRCKNRQQQDLLCKDLELFREKNHYDFRVKKNKGPVVPYHKQMIRDYKKYITRYLPQDDYA